MMKHIENLGIVRTVYSGIFGDIQQYLAGFRSIFRDFQVYCGTLRHIKALLWQIEQYLGRFRTLRNPCIHNRAHTCIYSEPQHIQSPGVSSNACQTCQMIRYMQSLWHNQNSLFKYSQGYLGIFRYIDPYLAIFSHYSFCKTLHLKCLTVF